MNSIFMVALNDTNPGAEMILGFYPTLQLAEARKTVIEADPDWQSEDADVRVFIHQFSGVTAEGINTSFGLR